MTTAFLYRLIPPSAYGGAPALHLVERNVLVARRIWLMFVSGFFEPVFYLFAVGVGIGELVGEVAGPGGRLVDYADFVAPALLAASAMNAAVFDAAFAPYFKLRFAKTYDAIVATPMRPGDIAVGEITWSLMRGAVYTTAFLLVMNLFGHMPSQWGWLAVAAALLVGFAFAAVGMAASTYLRSWQDFDLITLVTLPLFLFSGTFYPLSVYPGWLQVVARISPLYHGVEIIRALTIGVFDPSLVGHVAFLATMGLTGGLIAARRMGKLLLA